MKIVAGIDFGTSMSMIQTLDHDGCEQEMTECKTVRFTQSAQAATPTLVRVEEETGYEWFGEEAQNVNKGMMYENFKLALRSEDPQERERARDLVERFFRYLYNCYKEEKNKLYPGAQSAQEETVVGHPVQWDEAQRSIILDAARKAGFKNVRGKDEASASVLCVMTHNQEALRRAGYLQKGKPLNVMVLDMGAGTTDLAFVQVTEQNGGVDIQQQGTWPPKDYPEVFGGSRIDQVLAARMTDWLNACSLPASLTEQFIKGNYLSLKNWKEYNVSSDLEKNLTVDSCTALGMAMSMVQYMPGVTAAPFPSFGRTEYEEMMAADLKVFVNTIRSAPENLREQTDLVFVTGGNSQWYWVPEILSGENTRFGDVGLPKIKGNLQAIQKTTYPTETVSRGLVYRGKGIRFVDPPKVKERKVDPPKVVVSHDDKKSLAGEIQKQLNAAKPIFKVEDIYTIAGRGIAVTGMVLCESISIGEIVRWRAPDSSIHSAVIAGIEMNGKLQNNAKYGNDVGLLLSGVDSKDIQVGCLLVDSKGEVLKADISEAVPSKNETIQMAVPQSDEDIFVEWSEKRSKSAYPDMKMLERMYADIESTIAVSDSGRVLATTQDALTRLLGKRDFSALHDVDAVFSANMFRTKDGRVVDHSGTVLWKSGMHPAGNPLSGAVDWVALDPAGRVWINPRRAQLADHQHLWSLGGKAAEEAVSKALADKSADEACLLSFWSHSLKKLYAVTIGTAKNSPARSRDYEPDFCDSNGTILSFVGLTKAGRLISMHPDMRKWLRSQYPALTYHSDQTFGEGIVDFCFTRISETLYLLTKQGELYCYTPGASQAKKCKRLNIAYISLWGGDGLWAIDDSGNLIKWPHKGRFQTEGEVLMTECIAAVYENSSVIAMDKNGKVKYVYHTLVSRKRRGEVEAWNIHDAN